MTNIFPRPLYSCHSVIYLLCVNFIARYILPTPSNPRHIFACNCLYCSDFQANTNSTLIDFQEVHLVKGEGERLGMHIKGGMNGQRGNPLDPTDEGVFISKINSSGTVRRDGRLRVGMRILEVNGASLLGATHEQAVEVLRTAGNELYLVVCKGYEKSDLIHAAGTAGGMSTGLGRPYGSRASETGSELSQSVSSLDQEMGDDSAFLQQVI